MMQKWRKFINDSLRFIKIIIRAMNVVCLSESYILKDTVTNVCMRSKTIYSNLDEVGYFCAPKFGALEMSNAPWEFNILLFLCRVVMWDSDSDVKKCGCSDYFHFCFAIIHSRKMSN